MGTFEPTEFNFVKLVDFQIPEGVPVYEYRSHRVVDGCKNFFRLNLYLVLDHDYVTIWHGLLEPLITEARLTERRFASVQKPSDLSFVNSYNEVLFRGHIDSNEVAAAILKALRLETAKTHYAVPQMLTVGSDNALRCGWIDQVD